MTEAGFETNPYPLDQLSEAQKPIYDEWRELFDICHTPPPLGIAIGTVVMPTGDLMDRAGPALDAFKRYAGTQETPPHLVVTGKWSNPEVAGGGATAEKVVRAMKIFGDVPPELKDRIIPDMNSGNTKEQAQNVYDLLRQGKIDEPWVVIVSQYHLPRLVSAFAKHILRKEPVLHTRMYTIPVDLPWNEQAPLVRRGQKGATRWESVFSEMERIHKYRINETKDVATKEEMLEYANWLREQ